MDFKQEEIKTVTMDTTTKGIEEPSVKIKVLFFAKARDIAGLTDMPLEVSSGSTAEDCLNKVTTVFPSLEEIRGCMVLALNEEYTSKNCEIVLKVLMHCEGCKTQVSNCLRYFEGVEEVVVDYPNHRVFVNGKKADPLKVLERVQKKYSRNAELISPKPIPRTKEKKEPEKKPVPPPPVKVVVLKTLMHCQGCEVDIKRCLEEMKGVLNAEANMETSMVTVRGIVDPPKLLEHIKKHLGKHAEVEIVKLEGDKGQAKDKGDNNKNNSNANNNKKCPEVLEIKFQYPPQYSVDHIYPCQDFSDENPLACSIM